jgi:BirA family biotin operon repressor/biotin-[acetyl-CoA-carboxylase] ligase
MPPSSASRDDLAARLAGTRFCEVRWFETIDSTNRYLVAESTAGRAPAGLVAVADEQRAGRGRLGRSWIAPPGASLLASVLLGDALPPERRHLVVVAAALGAIDAVAELCGFRPRLKWPNDLVVDDRKLAGLLAEATAGAAVVGMGLNVDWPEFPAEIAATATACNREGRAAPRAELLIAWLRGFDTRLDRLVADGPARLAEEHRANSATVGRRVRVERAHDVLEGDAVALTELGHLVVRRGGEDHTVSAGDVVHLRPSA